MSDLAVARRVPQDVAELGATRASFDRTCLLLSRYGRIAGLRLSRRDFRVLLFLLGQKPGYFGAPQDHRRGARLEHAPHAGGTQRAPGGGACVLGAHPTAPCAPHGPIQSDECESVLGKRAADPVTARCAGRGASDGTKIPRADATEFAPSSPPQSEPERTEPAGTGDEAVSKPGNEPKRTEEHPSEGVDSKTVAASGVPRRRGFEPRRRRENGKHQRVELQAPAELEPVLASWRELKLGEPDGRSIRALVNRRNEGATLEQLAAAVVGAGADEWLQRGRAKVPFAVVFASVASVERFAHEGRKVDEKREDELHSEAERKRKERERVKPCDVPRVLPRQALPALLKRSFQPMPAATPPPTEAQISARRADAKVKLEAWSLANGNL